MWGERIDTCIKGYPTTGAVSSAVSRPRAGERSARGLDKLLLIRLRNSGVLPSTVHQCAELFASSFSFINYHSYIYLFLFGKRCFNCMLGYLLLQIELNNNEYKLRSYLTSRFVFNILYRLTQERPKRKKVHKSVTNQRLE